MESLQVIIPTMVSDTDNILYDVSNPITTTTHTPILNQFDKTSTNVRPFQDASSHDTIWPPSTVQHPFDQSNVKSHLRQGNDVTLNAHQYAIHRTPNQEDYNKYQEKPIFQELKSVKTGTMVSSHSGTHSPRGIKRTATAFDTPGLPSSAYKGDNRSDAQKTVGKLRANSSDWPTGIPEVFPIAPNGDRKDDNCDIDDTQTGQEETTLVDNKDTQGNRESQMVTTLKWLSENYELSAGVCLPRCVLYLHYLDFCKKQCLKPSGAATFGKLIRQKFKNITTRRLGTRGQSKYHYYGIGIKESSVYYQSVYTGKGLTRFSGTKIKTEGSSRKYSLSSKTGTLLPDFPNARNLILPDEATAEKMETFIMMYRTHSQRILDTIITANFEEIQNLLVHFWQGYPQHLLDVLRLPVTTDVIAICDSILYKVLIDVLVPNAIQDYPDSLSCDLRIFLRSLPKWIQNSLDDFVPDRVREIKRKALQSFLRCINRQMAFVRMAQTARPHLTNTETTTQAVKDLQTLDFPQTCLQTRFALNNNANVAREKTVSAVFEDLKTMLQQQSHIETVIEWMDNLLDKYVLEGESIPSRFKERAGKFLLHWTMFGALIMKDLTLNNSKSFIFLHLLKLTMDEYIFLVLETQADKTQDAILKKTLQAHMKNEVDIPMSATVRNQSSRQYTSPKCKKRKVDDHEVEKSSLRDEPDTPQTDHYNNNCISSHLTPQRHSTSSDTNPQLLYQHTKDYNVTINHVNPPVSTSFSPSPNNNNNNDNNNNSNIKKDNNSNNATNNNDEKTLHSTISSTTNYTTTENDKYPSTVITTTTSTTNTHNNNNITNANNTITDDLLFRPPPLPAAPPHCNIPLSPMKYYSTYDRCPYVPNLSFNTYTDYLNQHNHRHQHHHQHPHHPHATTPLQNSRTFHPPPPQPPPQPAIHDHAHSQPFQPINVNHSHHHTYLTPPFADPCTPQLTYHAHQDNYMDSYRTRFSPLLRQSMYHPDSLSCPSSSLDGYQRSNLESFQLPTPTLDGIPTRHAVTLEGLSRPTAASTVSYDNLRPPSGSFYGRPHGDYQVSPGLPVGSLCQSRLDITSASSQYAKQDGLFYYAEDAFAPNMSTNAGFAGFGKSYLPSTFR